MKGHEEKTAIKTILIKSFWESGTLFSKRVLAAGGKSDGEFRAWIIEDLLMKSFWKSGNLFSKRFLAAGGKKK
jgi:hypothetical protein